MPAKSKTSKDTTKEILSLVKEKFDFVISIIKSKIEEIKRDIRKKITVYLLVFLGIFFILIGASQLLEAVFPLLSPGGGSLIIGFVLLIIGLIYSAGARKK